ncbi:serine/threonine protein kinase [Roseateles terrae]|uniref:Non-specific serine/threonine protein kinase n=1 Tax=Roseateles terrae TaxID=431060 RepID=A0ABR6GWZ1_9BURK|nr:HDOD domain-containing protein [Roseateles terrae]MBB3196276.1 non-specific serine/threonine protein kinase [Roseateles terrae]
MSETTSSPSAAPLRRFGRFELRALLHKSQRSMLWLVFDTHHGQEMLLMVPREKPSGEVAMLQWLKAMDAGSRIHHPNLGHVVETGRVDPWPYVTYDRALGETLEERIARGAPLPLDAAKWVAQALEGLAFAHEAGHAHRDIQLAHLLIDPADHVRVIGLEVAQETLPADADFNATRRAVREAAEEDVVSIGLVLHRLLSGRPVLDEQDLRSVMQRMQPQGQELVRMGWETPYPIPDPLRAIVNRATDRQARQRYHLARSFWRALDGWRLSAEQDDGGPIALLKDKMQRFGHLPSTSTRLVSTAMSSAMASQHASELAALALKDMALTLELLRRVNNALRQQGHASSGGTVLNMQRAIAMMGLNGLEDAARALKPWPGPMNEGQATFMQSLMRRVQRAGQVAQALRPAGYDGEVVYLINLMQNLGRLLVQYHFPDDAQQIRQLMVPPEPTEEHPNPRGLTEQSAAYAVLGCDLESLGLAVARYWGLGDELQHMMRRQPPDAPVRHPDGDLDILRLTCSLANELIDALLLPERKRQTGIELATRRYSRALNLGLREIYDALGAAQSQGETNSGVNDPSVGAAAAAVPRSRLRERAEQQATGTRKDPP